MSERTRRWGAWGDAQEGAPTESGSLDTLVTPVGEGIEDAAPDARYCVVGEIARGGMGVVLLADDTRLGRRVALKRILRDVADPQARLRFVEEARATAQLEHPNIVPVYELQEGDETTVPTFSMRYVAGRSLRRTLGALREGDPDVRARYGSAELLLVFTKICDAVAYAHARGVLHRDLKPENVLLGPFGEVFVVDWGLARADPGAEHGIDSVRERSGEASLTEDGAVLGTPGYMAPEQVTGGAGAVDARSDVFALGAILYELLTLERAISGQGSQAKLTQTLLGGIVPPRARTPGRAISAGMEAIALQALELEPDARFPSVAALRDAVAEVLEGARETARRREAAERQLADGYAHVTAFHAREAEAHRQAGAVAARRAAVPKAEESVATLGAIWEAQQKALDAAADARRTFWDAYGAMAGAVRDDPSFIDAREALVDMLVDRARTLEARGEGDAGADLVAIARAHDPPRAAARLDVAGRIDVDSDPPGAQVRLFRVEPHGPRLIEREEGEVGATPCRAALAPGEWIVELTVPGRTAVRVSVRCAGGETVAVRTWVPPPNAVAPGLIFIPGGRYRIAGVETDGVGTAGREVEIAPFAIGRCSVTMGEYARFLNMLAERSAEEAAARACRLSGGVYWRPDADGRYRAPYRDADGERAEADFPVVAVSGEDAEAYAAWLGAETGYALRLPTSDEWEAAARGRSDRRYVWGRRFDPALCWMMQSFAGAHALRPVGSRPTDRSVFGALDMAGLVRNFTAPALDAEGRRIIRGGATFAVAEQCAIAASAVARGQPYVSVGFRLAQSVAP